MLRDRPAERSVWLSAGFMALLAGGAIAQCGTQLTAMPQTAGIGVWRTATFRSVSGEITVATIESVVLAGPWGHLAYTSSVDRWNGTTWTRLAQNIDGIVDAVVEMPNGDVVVAGPFTTINGASVGTIARWDGTSWQQLGGAYPSPKALAVMQNGDLIVGGYFQSINSAPLEVLAKWDGSGWSQLGAGFLAGASAVEAVLVAPNGDLIVGGWLTLAGGGPASGAWRWDGASWTSLGLTMLAQSLAIMPNGDLVAGGRSQTLPPFPDLIRRWDGSAWSAVGGGVSSASTANVFVLAVAGLPNGDLVAGGIFSHAGGVASPFLSRWDGSTWQPIGAGVNNVVETLIVEPVGDLLIAGAFQQADGNPAVGLAHWRPNCPAAAAAYGSGCTSSGGPVSLGPTALPWIGGALQSRATGLPVAGLALALVGFGTQSVPLAAILPQGLPGCDLLVVPAFGDLAVSNGGGADFAVAIPNSSALAQQTFHQQVIALDLGPGGAITAISSSHALTLTIGTY